MALLPVKHLLTTYLPTDSENRPAVGFFSRRASLRHSACLSAPPFPRLEGGHGALFWFLLLRIDFHLGDALVDLYRCPLPHLVGDMGVGVQRGGTGHMAQDGREGLDCLQLRGQLFHLLPDLRSRADPPYHVDRVSCGSP